MRATDRIWLAITVAGLLGALVLRPLTVDHGYLVSGGFLMVVAAAIAIVGDRLRLNKALVTLVQVLMLIVVLFVFSIGPGDQKLSWWRRLGPLVSAGIDHMRVSAAPMAADAGAQLILAAVVAGMALIAGILSDALERPALSLAPLVTLFAIPAIALRTDLGWGSFVFVALGYLAILFADGVNAESTWTRNITADQGTTGAFRGSGIWRLGALVAIPAVVLSVVLGLVLPTFSTSFFQSFRPSGAGPVEMSDPQLDLRRNLQQPENRPVLSYTTNKDSGAYLRLTVLPTISPDGWAQSRVTLKQGALGAVPGVSGSPAQSRTTTISVRDFRSMYLPLPYAPRAHDAVGEWSYDPSSLMVIATGQDRQGATANLTYTAQSWDIEPDGTALSTARAGTPSDPTTAEVPADVPQSIVQLTNSLTQTAATPALKAAAIQSYLRGFSYSVQGASGATNYKAMETFLLQTKTGYCVQFAGSMALMARIAGIPSRVAVGFLPGSQQGGNYIVNTHDMHAWPELYFEGFGWVRFEPTPSVAVPPPWSVVAPNQPTPTESAVPEPSVSVSAAPSEAPTTPEEVPVETGTDTWQVSLGWIRGVLVAVLVVAVALTPWLLRRRRRAVRVGGYPHDPHATVAAAWAEVRDTWIDLGRVWPTGTARQIAGQVAAMAGDGEPRDALRRLVVAVERSRYAAALGEVAPLGDDVTTIVRALEGSVGWDGRLLARFRPVSLWFALSGWISDRWLSLVGSLRRRQAGAPVAEAASARQDPSVYQRP